MTTPLTPRPHFTFKRLLPVFTVVCMGGVIAVVVYIALFQFYQSRAHKRFDINITNYAHTFSQTIEQNVETVRMLASFVSITPDMPRKKFARLVRPSLKNPAIHSVGRASYRDKDHSDLQAIIDVAEPQKCSKELEQKNLLDIIPKNGRALLGKTNTTTATHLFNFKHCDKTVRAVGLVHTFSLGPKQSTSTPPQGLVFAIIDINELMQTIVRQYHKPAGLDVYLLDVTKPGKPVLLGEHLSRVRKTTDHTPDSDLSEIRSGEYTVLTINIAERKWDVLFKPVLSGLQSELKHLPVYGLSVTLVLTLFLAYYIYASLTRRLLLEDKSAQSAKLASLGEMLANISHEMSQPLNIIRLNAETTLANSTEPAIKQPLQTIATQCARMAEIIDNVRQISRKDTKIVAPFDPLDAVRDVCTMLKPQLAKQNITLALDLPQTQTAVLGRHVAFEQIIMNLITNARDSILEKREITRLQSKGAITVQANVRKHKIHIDVIDNGAGIESKVLGNIFEPFFTTKAETKGTGLGLSICKKIIETMNGRIDVQSRVNKTVFSLSLPLSLHQPELATPPIALQTPPKQPDDKITLLLVDDEAEALRAMTNYFEPRGYNVLCAQSPKQAEQLFKAHGCDILLTDVYMPDGNGLDLVERLKLQKPDLTVLVVSGEIDTAKLTKHIAGFSHTAFIAKPAAPAKLESEMLALVYDQTESQTHEYSAG